MWSQIERDVRPRLVLVVWRCGACSRKACTVGRAAGTHPWSWASIDDANAYPIHPCACGAA